MTLKILKVEKQPSKQGGFFYYIFSKSLEPDGRAYRTCTGPLFGNFRRWQPVIQMIERGFLVTITNVITRGRIADADSQFSVIEAVRPEVVVV